MDPTVVTTIAIAGVGAASTVAGYVVRSYVQAQVNPLDTRLTIHEKEDTLIHGHVKESLERIEAKLDKVLEAK